MGCAILGWVWEDREVLTYCTYILLTREIRSWSKMGTCMYHEETISSANSRTLTQIRPGSRMHDRRIVSGDTDEACQPTCAATAGLIVTPDAVRRCVEQREALGELFASAE